MNWRFIVERSEKREILEAHQDKFPLPKNVAFNVQHFMSHAESFEALADSIAEGNSVRSFCRHLGMPVAAIVKMNRFLAGLKAPDPRYEVYMAAKRTRAHHHAQTMLDIIENVSDGVLTPQQGSVMVKGLQWLAARMDPDTFSDRIKVDARLKIDAASSHLEAVRQMAEMIQADGKGTVLQGEVVQIDPPEDEDFYKLLE
jgi:hypothetical protein